MLNPGIRVWSDPKAKVRVGHRDWDLVGTSLERLATRARPEMKGLGFDG